MLVIDKFSVEIETAAGSDHRPRFSFNGHVTDFDGSEGGTASGQTFRGSFEPYSFPHELTLLGPDAGDWRIRRIRVSFETSARGTYVVEFGSVTLDGTTAADIWRPPPQPVYDV